MQNPSKGDRLVLWSSLGLVILVTAAASFSEIREKLRSFVFDDSRIVLAKTEGDLTGQGDFISVVKVLVGREIFVEIYNLHPKKDETALRARFILPEKKDGFVEFSGKPTNLALADLNDDRVLEIVVPTYDESLIPRLHIYRYDVDDQIFSLAGPDFFPLKKTEQQ